MKTDLDNNLCPVCLRELYHKECKCADASDIRPFADSPGGVAGAFLSVLAALCFFGLVGIFIYIVLAKIFGWPL